jgi:isopenicillin-N N-acyltransferase-like protein
MATLPFIRAKGSHKNIGLAIGTELREVVRGQIEAYSSLMPVAEELGLTWTQAVLQARKYLPFAEEFFPQYVEEMHGIAQGAGVNFDDVNTLNSLEAVTSDALHLKCTSLAAGPEVTESGSGVFVAHNEDWIPADAPFVYVLQAEPDDEPGFLGVAYGALLPNLGFNAAGLAHVADSVYPNDVRLGIPRIIVTRAVLGARSLGAAIKAVLHKRRAAGYNHLIADQNGEIYNIEVSATAFDPMYAHEHWTAHTNHYLSPIMRPLEESPEKHINSQVRLNRARHLLMARLGKLTMADFETILADHVNHPYGICGHAEMCDSPFACSITIASLIIDMAARTMWVCWGNPCQSDSHGGWQKFQLKSA